MVGGENERMGGWEDRKIGGKGRGDAKCRARLLLKSEELSKDAISAEMLPPVYTFVYTWDPVQRLMNGQPTHARTHARTRDSSEIAIANHSHSHSIGSEC